MSAAEPILTGLAEQGYWRSPVPWAGMAAVTTHLRGAVTYSGHVVTRGDRQPRCLNDCLRIAVDEPSSIPNQFHFASHTMGDILAAPGLLDFILPFTDLAEMAFCEPALLYSVNAFWKKPGGHEQWHNDTDDRKIMALFIYGTDIMDAEAGPHSYAPGTHKWSTLRKQPYNDAVARPTETTSFFGRAGSWFLTNTWGLHNGFTPAPGRPARLLLWARWGVSAPPKSYREDGLKPTAASKLGVETPSQRYQDATRLVVDWTA